MTAPLRLAVALALCLVACHTGAVQSPERFEDSWGAAVGPGNGVVRAWPGADWHATRQEDWQVRGTTVECRNSKAGTSGRTLALLTRTIEAPVLEPIRLKLRLETLTGSPIASEALPCGNWKSIHSSPPPPVSSVIIALAGRYCPT